MMSANFWASGTQCVAKCDHTKPKAPEELCFRKGDILTIVEPCETKGQYRAKHNTTGAEGLLFTAAVREREAIRVDPKLSLMPWFHGKISGPDAVQQLQPPENGLFLIRESIRHPGDYVLCVSFDNEVIHYRVIYKDCQLTIDEATCFYNLIELIEGLELRKTCSSNDGYQEDHLYHVVHQHGLCQGLYGALYNVLNTKYYMKTQGAICTRLVKPKPKQGTKSAEDELAKAGWLLNMQHLSLGDKIGEGEFGAVLQGEYIGQKVAVKNIRCDVTAQAFLAETAAMTKVQHKNLVRLLGVILHNGLYIVMEFMSKGSLVNFLRTRGRSVIHTGQLLQFSLNVSDGMDYLESKKLVHRDLAARNILISKDNVAKISDFGLAKVDLKCKDLTRIPIKWTAPEALKHNKFSTKSDVWSFGVLLWEIFSYGRAPYPKLSLKEVCEKIEKGYRMEAPEHCPPSICILMNSCWEMDPGKRPSFKKLREKLEKELKAQQEG